MSEPARITGSPTRPDLKPRKTLFVAAIGLFTVWVALLAWLYVSQIVLKRG